MHLTSINKEHKNDFTKTLPLNSSSSDSIYGLIKDKTNGENPDTGLQPHDGIFCPSNLLCVQALECFNNHHNYEAAPQIKCTLHCT